MGNPNIMTDITGYMNFEQAERFVHHAKNDKDRLIFLLMWRCGMRVSEVIHIKKKWIYFDERVLAVFGKGKKFRRIPIDTDIITLLKKYIKKFKDNDRLVQISRQAIFKKVRKYGEVVGVPIVGNKSVHPHHFRHSFAVHMVKSGMPLEKLQKMLGHASLSATTFYMHFKIEELVNDYQKIWDESLGRTRK